jgi:cell division protein FtsL
MAIRAEALPVRRVQPNLRVAPQVGVRRSHRLLITLCTLLTVGLAFAVVASQVLVAQNQDRLDKLNHRVDAAQARYERLRYQVAELESPERIVAAARDRLGMVQPAHVTYVAPVTATAADASSATATAAPDWRLVKAQLAAK